MLVCSLNLLWLKLGDSHVFQSGACTFVSSLFRRVVEQEHLPMVLYRENLSTIMIAMTVIVITLLDTNEVQSLPRQSVPWHDTIFVV